MTKKSIGLTLSGGGFRATLFHLGVLRHLAESGKLDNVSHICSVSGGSVVAAHLVSRWEEYLNNPEDVEQQILDFAARCVRGRIVRRLPILLLSRMMPFRTGYAKSNVDFFQRELDKCLYHGQHMHDLPDSPSLHLLATNMTNGGQVSFTQLGFSLDFGPRDSHELLDSVNLPVSLAVACSAAFPALFSPILVDHHLLGIEHSKFGEPRRLSDGGIYDNLGLRKLIQLDSKGANFDEIIVSDASGAFDNRWFSRRSGIVGTTIRSSDILMNRIYELDREHLISSRLDSFKDRLRIVDISEPVPNATLPKAVQDQCKLVRTDFDQFSAEEQSILLCHGYEACKQAITGASSQQELVSHAVASSTAAPKTTTSNSTGDNETDTDSTESNVKLWEKLHEADQHFCNAQDPSKLVRILQVSQLRKLRMFSIKDYVWVIQLSVLFAIIFIGIPLAANLIERTRLAILPRPQKVVIAGKQFTESSILLEVMALVIAEEAPELTIERKHFYGNNIELYHDLIDGKIDVYPEYTGTVLTVGLGETIELVRRPEENQLLKVNSRLSDNARAKDLEFVSRFGFNNSYEFVVLKDKAIEWGFADGKMTMTDLAEVSNRPEMIENPIRFGFTPTFTDRPDGVRNLDSTYGIKFKETHPLKHEVKYERLIEKRYDVVDGYSSDPQLLDKDTFTIVEDDKNAWPIYDAASITRHDFIATHPKVLAALKRLSNKITISEMAALLKKAESKGSDGFVLKTDQSRQEDLRVVVREFLVSKGIIGGTVSTVEE